MVRDDDQRAVIQAYFAACRARIPEFAARHLGWAGTLRLHRQALGLDLLRAPFNVLLVGPALFLRLAGLLARWLGQRRLGDWLMSRDLFLETRLSQRIAELVDDELLELGRHPDVPTDWRHRFRNLIAEYVAARHAAAEFGAVLVIAVLGLWLLHALTPSAISLGPMLAQELARREAVEGFWLGSTLGAVWYGWFPTSASGPELVATTLAVMVGFALLATFAGLVMDPLQQMLGIHRYRLLRLVDAMERAALGEENARLTLPDPYIARLTDILDVVLIATRMSR